MFSFHDKVVIFSVQGLDMVGNLENGIVIGLDRNGKSCIDELAQRVPEAHTRLKESIPELEEALLNYGFYQEEKAPLQSRGPLKTAYIHFNSTCNLHCVGCYSYVDNRNESNGLTRKRWFDILLDLRSNGLESVIVSGGEPFLNDDLPELCKYMRDIGIDHITAITNGTMPMNVYQKTLPYLSGITVSVDGYDENTSFIRDTGIMPKVIDTVQNLNKELPTAMVATLHKRNQAYMQRYTELSARLQVPLSYSLYTVELDSPCAEGLLFDPEQFALIGQAVAGSDERIVIADTPTEVAGLSCRISCGFGCQLISVDHMGNVYPCHMLHLPECVMGNLGRQKMADILSNPMINTTSIDVNAVEGCRECEYKLVCGGGCRGRSYLYHKSFFKKDPYCVAAKSFYDKMFDDIRQRVR